MSIGPIELLWITTNGFTFLLTAVALIDALQLPALEPGARQLVARGNIRRELLRLVVQTLLLLVAVPGLFSDREITLTPALAALIAVPVVLLISTIFDALDRRKLRLMAFDVIKAEQASALERIEAAVAVVGDKAEAAYHEANQVNQKIDARTHAIAQGADVDKT